MLSKVIQEKIEKKYGHPIRYPKDCHALAAQISQVCKTPISASTLKRLYGFVKGIESPRLYTLDIISVYLGHKGWEELSKELSIAKPEVKYTELEELVISKLKKGEWIQIRYEPRKQVKVQYQGKYQFEVASSSDNKIREGDVIAFDKAILHYPLVITSLTRNEQDVGQLVIGGISGITSIRKIREEKP